MKRVFNHLLKPTGYELWRKTKIDTVFVEREQLGRELHDLRREKISLLDVRKKLSGELAVQQQTVEKLTGDLKHLTGEQALLTEKLDVACQKILARQQPFGNLSSFSKTERYLCFLETYLPRLAAHALYPQRTELSYWRGEVLANTVPYFAKRPGICLEFGVYKGNSINHCARRCPDKHFFGFDSFEGFPDDGRVDWQQDFRVINLPAVPSNVTLLKGWFSDTLPEFLTTNQEPLAFVNIDCDLYSSTRCVFENLSRHRLLHAGLVIHFDELINYDGYLANEMLALFEMLEETNLGVAWLCCHTKVRSVEDSLRLSQAGQHPTWENDLQNGYRQQASLVLTSDGLDYALLSLPHVRERIKTLAAIYDTVTEKTAS